MTALRITTFRGIKPIANPRLLDDNEAQIASNCDVKSGALVPVNRPQLSYTPGKPLPALAIYKAVEGLSSAWMTWPYDVDVVRIPLPADVAARFAWTGDGEPRWAKMAQIVSGGGNDYPAEYYALGIPAPTAAPGVSASGGASSVVETRFYTYTFFSQDGEESGPAPVSNVLSGKVDDTWSISGMSALPANNGTGTASYASGVTTFTNNSSAPHWLRVGEEVVIGGATVSVLTTPTADSYTVSGDYHAETTWARKAPWNTTGMKMRLYRTAGSAAQFQLVLDDVLGSPSYNAATNTFSDTLSGTQIMGDELISLGWEPAPAGLRGLIVTASGALAGFVGNVLRLSEPSQGHAWPSGNAYRCSPQIVSIAPMGSGIGVGTVGVPHVCIGSDPSAMALLPANVPYPCLSKRSMVSDGSGVLFASNVGLVRLDQSSQATVFSQSWFGRGEWSDRAPSTMVCAVGPGKLYVAYTASGRTRMLVWDMIVGELVESDVGADDIYVDEATGDVYISDDSGINALFGGSYPSQLVWRSKEYVLPKPVNFGAAKVRFALSIDEATRAAILQEISDAQSFNASILSSGKLEGGYNWSAFNVRRYNGSRMKVVPDVPPSNSVTFTLYTDGAQRFVKTVTSSAVFRLPSGYLSGRVSVQVASACEVRGIEVAGTAKELETV